MSRFCTTCSVPKIQNQHHFVYSAYVFKKELQDQKKIRKWSNRTRVGINLGNLSWHALNVSLILNLQTCLVSPQYHCKYDDLFETTTDTQARSIPTSQWQYKAGLVEGKPELSEDEQMREEQWEEQSLEEYYLSQESEEVNTDSEEENMEENNEDNPDIYITRLGRKSKAPERLQYDVQSCLLRTNEHEQEEMRGEQNLLAYKASTDPETMYHHQAMKQPDKEKFQEAMEKECEAHYRGRNYKLIRKS
jgi:hypothetical protein